MELLESFVDKAKQKKRRIVLPESMDERIIEATHRILVDGVADIILVGPKDLLSSHFSQQEFESGLIVYDPVIDVEMTDRLAEILEKKRRHKGLTLESAREIVESRTQFFGALLVEAGEADGMVCGAVCTTGDTLRAIIQSVGVRLDSSLLSSFFIMITPDVSFGNEGVLFFADCAVNPEPTSDQLACIAMDTAVSYQKVMHDQPKVGMLSFSSKGSAKHELADKVILATAKVKETRPDLVIDGELQLDAAIVPKVAAKKAPNSAVAGQANCLIFPDLQSGNIGYKLTERLGKATAIGPIIQGAKKPINDLSRGCSVDDIYYVTAITSLQVE